MKTIARSIALISVLMISLYVNAGIPIAVHYQVSVHMPKERPINTRSIYVVMTDEHNRPVAPAQLLRRGLDTYHFFESASVKGTRKAQLIYSDGTTAAMFSLAAPDVQTGTFATGFTYLFNLYVTGPTQINAKD